MIKKTALLLVLALSVGAVRLLTCELACADAAAKHQDATCHEESEAATTLVNGTSHECDYDAIAPSLAAQQKTTLFQQAGALFDDLLPRNPFPFSTVDEFLSLPPGAAPVSHPSRTSVLRI